MLLSNFWTAIVWDLKQILKSEKKFSSSKMNRVSFILLLASFSFLHHHPYHLTFSHLLSSQSLIHNYNQTQHTHIYIKQLKQSFKEIKATFVEHSQGSINQTIATSEHELAALIKQSSEKK